MQIPDTVDRTTLFRHYVYTPSASTTWRAHCEELAGWLWDSVARQRDAFVVELASNDGRLLKAIRVLMPRVLGVEPALNIAAQAVADGIPTLPEFFGRATAQRIRADEGPADIIVGTNVLAHVPDLLDFLRGAADLLGPNGVFVVEAPYVLDLVDQVAFDTIYHEHVSYFSVTALQRIYPMAGLELTSVEQTPVHGGSIRFTGQLVGHVADESVALMIGTEERLGYADGSALADFSVRVGRIRGQIHDTVAAERAAGRTIAAYGATAKGNTLLTTCGIGRDDNPLHRRP